MAKGKVFGAKERKSFFYLVVFNNDSPDKCFLPLQLQFGRYLKAFDFARLHRVRAFLSD
jgi:hypothetical protein